MQQKLQLMLLAAIVTLTLAGCDAFRSVDARVARADERIAAHDYRGAMIELKNAVQKDPTHVEALLKLVEVALQLGDAQEAEADLRRAIQAGAPPQVTAEPTAKVRMALGQFRELLTQMDSGELVLAEPARSLYRGQASQGLQQFEPALAAFQAALQSDPSSIDAHIGIAEVHAAQGSSDTALVDLEKLIKEHPDAARALLARGSIRARRGEFELAEQDLQQARQHAGATLTASQNLNLLTVLVEVQLARGDSAAAANTQAELAKIAPGAVTTRVLAARIAMAKQDYATAVGELQRCVTAAPDFVVARFLLGAALLAQGNLQQADVHLTQALQRAPENTEARKLLAQVRLRLGRPDAAMQVLLPMQPADNSDPQLDLLLGLAHLQQGERSTGIEHLERAAAARPDNRSLQMDLASAYIGAEQAEKAIALLSRLPPGPDDVRQSTLLITALIATHDERGAQQRVERLLADHPKDATVQNLAAGYFARQRQFDRARELLQRAATADPKQVSIVLTRARIEAAAGDLDASAQWLKKAVAIDEGNATARLALSEIALRRGDNKEALAGLEDLRKRDANAAEPRLRLAALYLQQKNTAAADAVIKELDALAEGRAEMLNALGQLYLDAGRYEEALLRFRSATGLDGANPIYWFNVARAQIALGNSPVARETLEKALTLRPNWVMAIGTLAMLDIRDNKPAAALSRIAEARKAQPSDPATLMLEGDVMMAVRDYRKASDAYDSANALKPSGVIAVKSYRARQLAKLPEPTRPLESWVASEPGDSAVRMLLAEAYQQSGDKRRAIGQYEVMQSAGTPSPIMLNNLAWLYHETGDARAEPTAKRAYDSAPGVAAVADTYGWILVQSGKPKDAVELLRQAAATGKDPTIEYHYAAALAGAGDKEQSRRLLTELLGRSSSFEGAGDARKLLQSLPDG